MALTTRRYGRYVTAVEADYGVMSAGDMRASLYDASDYDIWVVSGSLWCGKSSGTNATMRVAGYEGASNALSSTSDLTQYTDAITVNTSMTSGSGGAAFTGTFATPWLLRSGRQYGGAALVTGAGIEHSMKQAAAITADNELFYQRTGLSQPPPDPFGAFTSSTEGHLSLWFTGYENEAPLAADTLSPSGTINETAPTFSGAFRDLNGAYGTSSGDGFDTGDQLNQYQVQVRASGSTTLLWNTTYTATSAERAADAMSRAYGGSTLTRGTTYEWRVRMSDDASEWGAWTDWTEFTPSNLGYITLHSTPSGKTEDASPDFLAKWTHQAALSTNAVQIKIRDANTGAAVMTSGVIAKTVASSAAPGTAFTFTWAQTGFSLDLAWGRNYTYEIRGRDTNNVWSDWSAAKAFNTNAGPSIPSGLSPRNSQVVTAYPLLSCVFTDTDDTTATGLTGGVTIVRPDLSTTTATLTYNATTAKWEYQTTGTQITATGTYQWTAWSYDGTLYSGESTTSGGRTDSAPASFVYAVGPTVTITNLSDGDTVATASQLVEWSSSGFTDWEVLLYEEGTTTLVYSSGSISEGSTQTTGSHTIPSGYYRNGSNYDIVVTVIDATLLVGSTTPLTIEIAYTAADAVANVQATAFKVGTDIHESAIRVTWDATAYTAPEFVEYVVTRSASGGVDASQIVLARITSPTGTGVVDYFPASGYDYTYGVSVTILTGLDELQSDPVDATVSLAIEETVLCLVSDPGTYRAILTNVTERSMEAQNERATYVPLSDSLPTTVRAASRYKALPVTAKITGDSVQTAVQRRAELDGLDAALGTVCMRYADGSKYFVDMQGLKITDEHGGFYTATFTAVQQQITEGTV